MTSWLPHAATLFAKLPRSLRRHRLITAWMRLTGEDALQLVNIRDRSFGYADMSDGFLRLIVIDGEFEHDFFRIGDALLYGGGIFVDVGANHGLISFGLAGRHTGAVEFHLFEPNPALVTSILRTFALYPGMQCRVNADAVADHEGTVSFTIDHSQTGLSHISAAGSVTVPAITLDHYFAEQAIERIELLKLDIEGYELHALRGAHSALQNRRIQAIYFEYFEKYLVREQPPTELLQFLDDMGYTICFCRLCDLANCDGPSHTIRDGLPGHGLPLRPVAGLQVPSMTDLLAVPAENLVATPASASDNSARARV